MVEPWQVVQPEDLELVLTKACGMVDEEGLVVPSPAPVVLVLDERRQMLATQLDFLVLISGEIKL
jgi:hypothetical protein